jgi:hypothetical protein
VLTERGLVTEPPSPVAGDEYDELEPEAMEYEDGVYTDESGAVWQMEAGQWSQVQESEAGKEEPPEDQWPNYLPNNEGHINLTDDEEDWSDDA